MTRYRRRLRQCGTVCRILLPSLRLFRRLVDEGPQRIRAHHGPLPDLEDLEVSGVDQVVDAGAAHAREAGGAVDREGVGLDMILRHLSGPARLHANSCGVA